MMMSDLFFDRINRIDRIGLAGEIFSHKGTKVTKDIKNGVSFVTFVPLCEKKEKQGGS